jgi:hypothetical protein
LKQIKDALDFLSRTPGAGYVREDLTDSPVTLSAPEGSASTARATVSVNALGALDLLQIAVSGLKPDQSYTLWLATSRTAPFGKRQPLTTFKANLAGAQVAQAVGPFRQILSSQSENAAGQLPQRFLLLTPVDTDAPELVQSAP